MSQRAILLVLLLVCGSYTARADESPARDLLDLASGGIALSSSSQYSDSWTAVLLLDGTNKYGWCNADGVQPPHVLVFELARNSSLQRFVLDSRGNNERSQPGMSPRRFELSVSSISDNAGFERVLEGELAQGERSEFPLPNGTTGRWVRLDILSNWGSQRFTEFMELELLGLPIDAEAPVEQVDVTGVYDTEYGPMGLLQVGSRITGCYWQGKAVVNGDSDGRVIRLEWWHVKTDGKRGPALFVVPASSDRFHGLYYMDGAYGGPWNGERTGDDPGSVCGPEFASASTVESALSSTGQATLYGVQFDLDSDSLRLDSDSVLQELLGILSADATLRLEIEGHTDDSGDEAYNLGLSRRRAVAVAHWLQSRGVNTDQLGTLGLGETRPVADNATPQGRALNRRVVVRAQ